MSSAPTVAAVQPGSLGGVQYAVTNELCVLVSLYGSAYVGGAVKFQSSDDGTNFYDVAGTRMSDPSVTESSKTLDDGTNYQWLVPVAGARTFQVLPTALTTGPLGVRISGQALPINAMLAMLAAVASTKPALTDALTGVTVAQQSNGTVTALASAARTATAHSATIDNYNAKGAQAILDVTVAVAGTGGLQVQFEGKDPVSGKWYALNAAPTAVVATGTTVYELYPGIGSATGGVTQRTSGALPRQWRVTVTAGDSTSYTYSVGVNLIL